jgi:tRNA(Ile2) C34 agmatinyltransferase TiaS
MRLRRKALVAENARLTALVAAEREFVLCPNCGTELAATGMSLDIFRPCRECGLITQFEVVAS